MEIISRTPTDYYSNSEVWIVRSQIVGDLFRVCVTGPDVMPAPGQRAGALYSTDASLLAGTCAGTLRACALVGELPPLFSVSIGYPTDAVPSFLLKRNRDLSPTLREDNDPIVPMLFGLDEVVPSGGASEFLAFLVEELRPALVEAFPIDGEDSAVAGVSFGGLFALYTLLERPTAFSRYLAISSSIWWDDRLVLRQMRARVAEGPAPAARVYLGVGELESREHAEAILEAMPQHVQEKLPPEWLTVDMHGDMFAMETALKPWSGADFSVEAHIFEEESHQSVAGVALSRGLRKLFASPSQ